MEINQERLAETFVTLCEIDSPSRQEAEVAAFLRKLFDQEFPKASLVEDQSARLTRANCGNLICRFEGTLDREPIFFNSHMDTVGPATGVWVRRQGSIFSSAGDTVLGGDDKSGIAILIEMIRVLREHAIPHSPIELIFTTCEEIGLLGAKHLDYSQVRSRMGYALDSTGVDLAIIGAPAANHLVFEIHGVAAHAGLHPEQGVNAIQLASQAVAALQLGRLDSQSSANIGVISGGTATNIIPPLVRVEGEVRSHSERLLESHTSMIEQSFRHIVDNWQDPTGQAAGVPRLSSEISLEYPLLAVDRDEPVVRSIERAATALSRSIDYIVAGGGSDANIFAGHGLKTVILGTGMNKVHTTDEHIDLNDMIRTAELLLKIVTD